jgi:hypothetical protein
MVCTFFGHSECYGLDAAVLRSAIEKLIKHGVTEFLVGNQGQFDAMVRNCLKSLQQQYPDIRYTVVLAYLPKEKGEFEDFSDTMYPEGIECVHPKFAIDWRNRFLISSADVCLCFINRTFGGAYKFAHMAKTRGLTVINLGNATL